MNTTKAFLTGGPIRPKLYLSKVGVILIFKVYLQRERLEGGRALKKLW